MISILPFTVDDAVVLAGRPGAVVEVRGDRIVVRTVDGIDHITSEAALREQQPRRRQVAS